MEGSISSISILLGDDFPQISKLKRLIGVEYIILLCCAICDFLSSHNLTQSKTVNAVDHRENKVPKH
jgi:hypothetical protein